MDGTDFIRSQRSIERVLRSAARRRFAVLTIEQLAFALVPVLGGFILLLLAGTQILHWYWLGFLAAAGSAVVVFRVRIRTLSYYQTAQLLDKRLGLDDSLSTAWFLLEQKPANSEAAAFQLRQTEQIARRIEPRKAFPLGWQRSWALTSALASLAFGLFAIRYLVTQSLKFEQSLIPVQFTAAFERLSNDLFASNRAASDPLRQRNQSGTNRAEGQLPDQNMTEPSQQRVEQIGQSTDPNGKAVSSSQSSADADGRPQNQEGQSREDEPGNSQVKGTQSDKPGGDQTGKQQESGGQQGGPGLMDKMRDALSSLMAKMQQNSNQQAQQKNGQSDPDKAGNQKSGKNGEQQDAGNQQSGQDRKLGAESQAQAAERTQPVQGRSSDSTPAKAADAHSGIGSQDGDKNVKEAEQLQAMGKLAEIIGKRSASLTGEMMVETLSGKQQLKTAYSQKLGQHSDSGGEINRDEIPLADQQYVRTYMELIRKQSKTAR